VRDDPEHVVHVGETVGVLDHFAQDVVGLVELSFLIVLAPASQELFDALIHGSVQ
jgi:hypothetical protein